MAQYNEAMKNLVSLVKPNGYVLIFSTIRENTDVGYYFVKNTKVLDLAWKRNAILEAIQSSGLKLLQEEVIEVPPQHKQLHFFICKNCFS